MHDILAPGYARWGRGSRRGCLWLLMTMKGNDNVERFGTQLSPYTYPSNFGHETRFE